MKLQVKQIGDKAHFEGMTESGHTLTLNSTLSDDEQKIAASPMESLLMAIASCSSVDVVLILKKMKQAYDSLEIDVEGERVQTGEAKPFRKIDLLFRFQGSGLEEKKLTRAVKLSVEKYCSVIESLHEDCAVNWAVEIESRK